jgi:phage terminase large subunit
MPFLRPLDYHANRFHDLQEEQWLAYKAGLTCVLPWGRRSGKSDFFAEVLVEDIEENFKPCLYLASTKISAREIMWPKLKDRLRDHKKTWKLVDQRLEAIYMPTETPIRLGGIENVDDLAGKAYRIIIADEYALWKKKNQRIKDIVKMILAPMLADYNGQFIYGSSKRGKNHFHELHELALKNPAQFFVNECTMFQNTFMTNEGRMKVVAEYDGPDDPLYQQEIANKYVSFQGMVFALDASDYTVERWDPADFDHAYHVRGVDHGFSPDPTACVWLAYNFRKGYWLVYSEYEEAKLLIKQHADIINTQEHWPIAETYSDVDPQIIAEYEDIGLAMTPAQKADKQARLLRLVNALRAGRLKIAKNCKKLLRQMASYEWDQDGNDHLIDAFNYGYNNTSIPDPSAIQPKHKIYTRSGLRPLPRDDDGQDFG